MSTLVSTMLCFSEVFLVAIIVVLIRGIVCLQVTPYLGKLLFGLVMSLISQVLITSPAIVPM